MRPNILVHFNGNKTNGIRARIEQRSVKYIKLSFELPADKTVSFIPSAQMRRSSSMPFPGKQTTFHQPNSNDRLFTFRGCRERCHQMTRPRLLAIDVALDYEVFCRIRIPPLLSRTEQFLRIHELS